MKPGIATVPPRSCGQAGDRGPGWITWEINRELFVLLGGPAAAVLQVAHPVVARGVAAHSRFREDSAGRLARTLQAVYAVTFGSDKEVERTRREVARAHRAVRGEGYSAFDPEAQRWVLATLIWCSVSLYERWIRKLCPEERERLLEENQLFAEAFGLAARDLWGSWAEFENYWHATLQSPELGALAASREITRAVLMPRTPWSLRLFSPLWVALARPFFPAPLAERLDFPTSVWEGPGWRFLDWFMPRFWTRLPGGLRFAPAYRSALRRLEGEQRREGGLPKT